MHFLYTEKCFSGLNECKNDSKCFCSERIGVDLFIPLTFPEPIGVSEIYGI